MKYTSIDAALFFENRKRFNEKLTGSWEPGDKIIKGTLHVDFEIDKNDFHFGEGSLRF